MDILIDQLRNHPPIALFLALSLGYVAGKLKIGKFELGGVAGSLLVAVFIGQVGGIHVSDDIKGLFFALFIFMCGYNGGPQFFASFNRASINRLIAAFMMCVLGLATVLGCAMLAGLDKGLAAGLAAGGLTQSAIIGTAGSAIDNLGLSAQEASTLKTNVAVRYSITYIFGSLGPILMVSLVPIVCGWNLREEAIKLAEKFSGGAKQLVEGEFFALNRVTSRAYRLKPDSDLVGMAPGNIEEALSLELTVESIFSRADEDNYKEADPDNYASLQAGDILVLSGLVAAFADLDGRIGEEVGEFSESLNVVEEARKLVISNKALDGRTIKDVRSHVSREQRRGVYVRQLSRQGHDIDTFPATVLHRGDEVTLVGLPKDLDRVESEVGYPSPKPSYTDFAVFSMGMVVGYLIGEISFKLGGTDISLGSGLGCLLSGLVVGYLRVRYPKCGAINSGAANFLQSFGLAVFVAIVGLNAGAPALQAIKEYGVLLLFLGMVVTMLPQAVQLIINYYMLNIRNPVDAMAVMVGSRSANPGFASLLEATRNSTPVANFTMTYAVANIFLTLWGPIVVALIP